MYAFILPEPILTINNWKTILCMFVNAYTANRQEASITKSCRNYRAQQLPFLHRGMHKQESGPMLFTQSLKGFEGNLQQIIYWMRMIPKPHSTKISRINLFSSSLQLILKIPASHLQQFWVIAWSWHLPWEFCDILQQRSLFSFKSQLENMVSVSLSLICKRLVSIHLGIRCSTCLIKYVNDTKVN